MRLRETGRGWGSLSLLTSLLLGCATSGGLQPASPSSPQQRAHRIYKALLSREGGSSQRDPSMLPGFAEAPLRIVRQLEALAGSPRGQERPSLLALSEALSGTGLFCKARFKASEKGIAIKYRPIARSQAREAHAGWNVLPVGIYEIWAERGGKRVSRIQEYELLQRQILIVVPGRERG